MARACRTQAPRAAGLIHSAGSWRRGRALSSHRWEPLSRSRPLSLPHTPSGSRAGTRKSWFDVESGPLLLWAGLLHEGGDLLVGGCAYCTRVPPTWSIPDPLPVDPHLRAVHVGVIRSLRATVIRTGPLAVPVAWDPRAPRKVQRPGTGDAFGDISVRPGTDDAVGDGIAVPDGVECPRPEGHAPGRVECPRRRRESGGSGCPGREDAPEGARSAPAGAVLAV